MARIIRRKIYRISSTDANIITLLLSFLFLVIGSYIQNRDEFLGIFVNDVFIFFIPALLISKGNRRRILKLRKIKVEDIFNVIIITILFYPIVMLFNGLFLSFMSQILEYRNDSLTMLETERSVISYIFYLAIVPAICEETFFRGVLTNAYEVYGRKFAIFMSAYVFAITHFNAQNFLAPFLLGLLFGNILERTGSLYGAIISHLTNNALALIASKYLNNTKFDYLKTSRIALDVGGLMALTILVLFIVSIISFILIVRIFKTMDYKNSYEKSKPVRKQVDIISFIPIIAMTIIYIIYNGRVLR